MRVQRYGVFSKHARLSLTFFNFPGKFFPHGLSLARVPLIIYWGACAQPAHHATTSHAPSGYRNKRYLREGFEKDEQLSMHDVLTRDDLYDITYNRDKVYNSDKNAPLPKLVSKLFGTLLVSLK